MRTRFWHVVGSVVAAGLIYTNVAVWANDVLEARSVAFRFGTGFLLHGLFNVGAVFSAYETDNSEIVLLALPRDAGDPTEESSWITLDLNEYFPWGSFAEQRNRVLVAVSPRPAETWRRADAPDVVARKIRERYNRQHPDHPIRRIRIRQLTWPRSPDGYWALKRPDTMTVRDLYTGPRSSG
jgi:hypothetical protein